MTRLQKKCLIAVAGTHLLAVVGLLCSGFIAARPEPDTTQVLDMIPANLIDKAFTSGVRGATPPPIVTPPIQTPTPPVPTPPPQKVEVKPVEPVKPPEKIPVEKPELPEVKPQKHEVTPDLKKIVHKNIPNTEKSDAEAKEAAKEAKRLQALQAERAKAANTALRAIKQNAPTSTTVDMPGSSTQAYADYASVVKTVYTAAWNLPDDTASDDANVKVSVTIANNGRVTEAHIVEKSGDAKVDNSVQRTLDRVSQLEPFPDGAKDRERTYIINFNLKAKRQLLG